jgi:hypothetical protein
LRAQKVQQFPTDEIFSSLILCGEGGKHVNSSAPKKKKRMSVDQALREVESLLNRLSIFRGKEQLEAATALEPFASDEDVLAVMDPSLLQSAFFVAKDAAAVAAPSESDEAALKVALQICANCCINDDDQTNRRLLHKLGVCALCEAVLGGPKRSSMCIYAVLDVISTLSTNNGDLRRDYSACIPLIFNAMRLHRANLDILFGACCALTTLTLADSRNASVVLAGNGFNVLLDVFKFAARRQTKPRSAPKAVTESEMLKEDVDSDEERMLLGDILSWAKSGLTNLVRSRCDGIDELLKNAAFGRFGDLLPVDELKWHLTTQRRRAITAT